MIDLLSVTAITLALLFYSGWGVTQLIIPRKLGHRSYVLALFVGLAFIDGFGHLTSFGGIIGRHSIWILLVVATLFNAVALLTRRGELHKPAKYELLISLAALPALVLSLAPLIPAGRLLPIGDTNGDPVAHATATEFLTDNTFRNPVPVAEEYPAYWAVHDKITRNVRLGFHFFQAYVDVLSDKPAYITYSVVVGVGYFLWALATGIFTKDVLARSFVESLLATLLLSFSSFPLWISFGGYGPQVVGMGLLVTAFAVWVFALQHGDWQSVVLAAVLGSGLAGIYSEALPWLILPAGIYGAFLFLSDEPRRWQIVKVGLSGAFLTILLNGVAWGRVANRVVDLSVRVASRSTGNVSWLVDFRQILSLIPFDPDLTRWYGERITPFLWLPAAAIVGAMVYGFWRLVTRVKPIALSFILPHLLVVAWFGLGPKSYPYAYFKAWSIGWFIYASLLAVGMVSLVQWARRERVLYSATLAGVVIVILLIILSNLMLVRDMSRHIPISSSMLEAIDWIDNLPAGDRVYLVPGDLGAVPTYWLAYLLRERPIGYSEHILYTNYGDLPYQGEPAVLRYTSAEPAWNKEMWREIPKLENQDFVLLELEPQQGRVFEPPEMQYAVDATLGGEFRLLGYDAETTLLNPGAGVKLNLYWQALQKIDQAYKIFVHLIDDDGRIVAQCDAHPKNWTYYTFFWKPGEIVKDSCEMVIEPEWSPGQYRLQAGLYLEESGERLPVTQNGELSDEIGVILDPDFSVP